MLLFFYLLLSFSYYVSVHVLCCLVVYCCCCCSCTFVKNKPSLFIQIPNYCRRIHIEVLHKYESVQRVSEDYEHETVNEAWNLHRVIIRYDNIYTISHEKKDRSGGGVLHPIRLEWFWSEGVPLRMVAVESRVEHESPPGTVSHPYPPCRRFSLHQAIKNHSL